MASRTASLGIVGAHGAVPHTFFRQDDEADHLAVVFPGMGYTCQMPLLYYPTRLLRDLGADVLWVEYDHLQRPEFRSLPDADQDNWFFADVAAACGAGLAARPYRRLTLVGKSLGTQAMGHVLAARLAPAGVDISAVWLTPLLRIERLRAQIAETPTPALFVIGSEDPHYDRALLDEVVRTAAGGGVELVVQGAGHSLEIAGDVRRSLRALEDVLMQMARLLERRPAS